MFLLASQGDEYDFVAYIWNAYKYAGQYALIIQDLCLLFSYWTANLNGEERKALRECQDWETGIDVSKRNKQVS